MQMEAAMSNAGNCNFRSLMEERMAYSLMVMFINSPKFAQASEMVRYIFMNSTGVASGVRNLMEKIEWFEPRTLIDKLYVLRMTKMSNMAMLMKSNDMKSEFFSKTKSDHRNISDKNIRYNFVDWCIAMPHETNFIPSDHHIYNSFYLCKTLSIQRHNKLVSEALVLEKLFSARQKFIDSWSSKEKHEARSLPMVQSSAQLLALFLRTNYSEMRARQYCVSPLTVIIGAINTLFRLEAKGDTYGAMRDSVYDVNSVMFTTKMSDAMNNRGSVADRGTNGVVLRKTEKYVEEGKTKQKTSSQNSKCYSTILELGLKYLREEKIPHVCLDWKTSPIEFDFERINIDKDGFSMLSKLSDNLWPVMYYFLHHQSQFVSKMVHKDQIGTREIAVLNAYSRLFCFYFENLARRIRDQEHAKGDSTNLIEIKAKDEITKKEYISSLHQKGISKMVLYESADCSKWGPAMMPDILYLTNALRMKDNVHRNIARSGMSLFSQKVFKIPDHFFEKMPTTTEIETNVVDRMRLKLMNMSPEMGLLSHQLIYQPESMHQGICGGTSSVLGSDCHRLAAEVTERMFESSNLKVTTKCTSDDYVRIFVSKTVDDTLDGTSISSFTKISLSISNMVLTQYGIKRNMEKSTYSSWVMEFNSTFYTPNGEVKPDVKSRISFIDVPTSSDPYPAALSCSTTAAEYLRKEGSLVGSCWVQLLNTHLCLRTMQGIGLWRSIGDEIFKIPLELGGMPEIDPLMSVISSSFGNVVSNYSPMGWSPEVALSFMSELSPQVLEMISSDPEVGSMKAMMPRMSRSGCVHLCKTDSRVNRSIRDFLADVPDEWFTELIYDTQGGTLLTSLMSCMQREESELSEESQYLRFSVCQTPQRAKLYLPNSNFLSRKLGNERVSRSDLHDLAIKYVLEKEFTIQGENSVEIMGQSFSTKEYPLFFRTILDDRENYLRLLSILVPEKIVPNNKRADTVPFRQSYAPSGFYEYAVRSFQELNKPKCLGGDSDVKPQLYLESEIMHRSLLAKLIERKQNFKITRLEGDSVERTFAETIIMGCIMDSCRLQYHLSENVLLRRPIEEVMWPALRSLATEISKRPFNGNNTIDILSPTFPAASRQGLIKMIDITSLLNITMGSSQMFRFADHRTKASIWHNLYMLQQRSGRSVYSVKVNDLIFPKKEYDYAISSGLKMITRPFTTMENEVIGSEFIFPEKTKKGLKYYHYLSFKEKSNFVGLENDRDEYVSLEMWKNERFNCSIEDRYGYMILVVNNIPLRVLCGSPLHGSHTVVLSPNNQLIDEDIFVKLDLGSSLIKDNIAMTKAIAAEIGAYPSEAEVPIEEQRDSWETEMDEIYEAENEFGSEIDDEMKELFGESDEEESMEQVNWASDVEDSEEENSEEEETDYIPVWTASGTELLTGDRVVPESSTVNLMAACAIRKLSRLEVMERKLSRRGFHYEITLPLKPDKDKYAGDSPLMELVEEFERKNENDSLWLSEFIRETLIINFRREIDDIRAYLE
jgi:hypothetical protein